MLLAWYINIYYRPKWSFGKGNIFTSVWCSVHRGGGYPSMPCRSVPGGWVSQHALQVSPRGWVGGSGPGGVSNFSGGCLQFSGGGLQFSGGGGCWGGTPPIFWGRIFFLISAFFGGTPPPPPHPTHPCILVRIKFWTATVKALMSASNLKNNASRIATNPCSD